jgi:peptidoglycan/LPS O-acetylase OafA/YrhL
MPCGSFDAVVKDDGGLNTGEAVSPQQKPARGGQGRDAAIDFLRAACILYIVGFWHLVPYTQSFPGYANVYTECIKDIALGTFVFCSGLLLAGRPFTMSWPDLAAFYRRRVVRIYPLYLVALLLFGVAGLAGHAVILNAIVLLSMFRPPAPYTLWFVSMIMTFYLVTPLLLWLVRSPRVYLPAGIALLVLGIPVHLYVHPLDTRILQYLPCFLLGIAWQRYPLPEPVYARRFVLLVAGMLVAFLLYRLQHGQELYAALGRIPAILAGTMLLYQFVDRYSGRLQSQLVARMAYASFCIYLFHRLVFHYSIGLYFPDGEYWRLAYLLGVVVPLIVVVSYFTQLFYDRVQRAV